MTVNVSVSPSRSVAVSCRETVSPSVSTCGPGSVSSGASFPDAGACTSHVKVTVSLSAPSETVTVTV